MPISRPIFDRFIEKVEALESGCWLWKGGTIKGYGEIGGRTVAGKHTMLYAHRFAYEHFIAPIPVGLQLDHLCRTPLCVNPTHLEPVTPRENTLRGTAPSAISAKKTHCPHGHPYDEVNTYINVRGDRVCRQCVRVRHREWKRQRRERLQSAIASAI